MLLEDRVRELFRRFRGDLTTMSTDSVSVSACLVCATIVAIVEKISKEAEDHRE